MLHLAVAFDLAIFQPRIIILRIDARDAQTIDNFFGADVATQADITFEIESDNDTMSIEASTEAEDGAEHEIEAVVPNVPLDTVENPIPPFIIFSDGPAGAHPEFIAFFRATTIPAALIQVEFEDDRIVLPNGLGSLDVLSVTPGMFSGEEVLDTILIP